MTEERDNTNNNNNNNKKSEYVIKIPCYSEVIENVSNSQSNLNLFKPSSSSFSQAFGSIKNTDFYSPPSRQSGQSEAASSSSYQFGQNRNAILVSNRQKGNPLLKHIRNVKWVFADIVCDYLLGQSTCALYLRKGYLAPYKGDDTRYHQQEFNLGLPPQNANERFNQLHSCLRSVIERTFGVWKSRWGILRDMPTYSMEKQVVVVGGSMGLHNFIRKHNEVSDLFYDEVMRNEQEMGEEFNDENDSDSMENNTELGDDVWIAFRNELRNRIPLINR